MNELSGEEIEAKALESLRAEGVFEGQKNPESIGGSKTERKEEGLLGREITAAEGADLGKQEQAVDSQLEAARRAIAEAAEHPRVEETHKLIADILNQKVDALDLSQGAAYKIREEMIEAAKRNAEKSRN